MEFSWLDSLEEKVRLATRRIQELQEENAELKQQLGEAEAASGDGDWQAEKQEIRERVEKLAHGLESLLADD